ncbi:MAG: amidohydrolase family protein, partial [Bacillota bacterium]|nr:amidohydrolase family protein [Bacillota bacterium]
REGIEVSLDQYPYKAGSSGLNATIPPEFHEGGTEKLVERLKDTDIRTRIKDIILDPERQWENMVLNCGFDGILVLTAKGAPDAEGKTVLEYAENEGMDVFDALFDILVATEGSASAAYFMMDDSDIEWIMQHPYTMVGTDGNLIVSGVSRHPRCIGTFPKVLGRYVREKKVLRLEEAIRKMTSLPSLKAGLKTKGLVKEGFDADLVIFNPDTVIDRADYVKPYLKNQGMEYVIVNGKIAVRCNKYTGAVSGKVIRVSR